MNQRLRTVVLVVLAAVFALSAAMVVYELAQYRTGAETYAEAEALVDLPVLEERVPDAQPQPPDASTAAPDTSADAPAQPEKKPYVDPYAQQLRNMDFSALREVNSDVLGWIVIPGTAVSYPLVQTDNNTYYLKHTWKKWSSSVGSIFLEQHSAPDLSDFHTIIYGHNMNNGSMFGSLKKYKKLSWWQAHPDIYLTTDGGSARYEIFAAYEVSTTGTTYQIGFSGDGAKQEFLDFCMAQSVIDTGVIPTVADRVLTLSTCTGHGHATRWVVQAVLKTAVPSDAAEEQQSAGDTVPADGQPVESAGDTAPADGQPAANTGDTIPADGQPVANTGDTIPADGQLAANTGDTAPADGQLAESTQSAQAPTNTQPAP